MRFNRPSFDPSVTHVVRGRPLPAADGSLIAAGESFPTDGLEPRRVEQLYRMGRIVRRRELGDDPLTREELQQLNAALSSDGQTAGTGSTAGQPYRHVGGGWYYLLDANGNPYGSPMRRTDAERAAA